MMIRVTKSVTLDAMLHIALVPLAFNLGLLFLGKVINVLTKQAGK